MKMLFAFVGDYLKGRSVYPVARKLLSFWFSVSIASFVFEKFYFKYQWLDITDYKAILNFLIKGYFFVPFCIYVIIHYSFDFASDMAYNGLISIKADQWRAWILRTKYKKSDSKKIIKAIAENSPPSVIVDDAWLFAIYQHFTNTFSQEQWTKMVAELEKAKRNNLQNLQLAFKTLITITIYFVNISYFGWKLFLATLVVLLCIIVALYFAYLLMEVLPLGIQKIHADVTAYFVARDEVQLQNQSNPKKKKASKRSTSETSI